MSLLCSAVPETPTGLEVNTEQDLIEVEWIEVVMHPRVRVRWAGWMIISPFRAGNRG